LNTEANMLAADWSSQPSDWFSSV